MHSIDVLHWKRSYVRMRLRATLGKGAFPVADGWTVTNASYRIYVPDEQDEIYRQAWPDYWAAPNNFQITKVIYGISSMPTQ